MTKRQLSRHEREVRRQRIAVVAVALALIVALLVPLYGYWREVIAKGGEPIAIVKGQQITTESFARFLGYQYLLLQRESQRLSDALAATTDDSEKQSLQLQQQILEQVAYSIPDASLDYLIDRPFVLEEAARLGITASSEEIDAALQQEMTAYTLGGLAYQTMNDVEADKVLPIDQARAELKKLVESAPFLTEAEVTELALTQRVLRSKIKDAVAADLPTAGEQVHARHILVEDEETAKAARERILNGEDFAAVAKELSTDSSNKDNGGDLGWFTRDSMIDEFADAAFSLPIGEISEPVQTTYGYHIIKVEEKDANRPFEESYLEQQRTTKFNDLLAEQKAAEGAVQRLDTEDKLTWANNYVIARTPAAQ